MNVLQKKRELLILRHAKSAWDTDAPTDFERPLNRRGKHDASRVGKWLSRQGWNPDFILSSNARRARQTVARVAKAMEFEREIQWEIHIYEATPSTLLALLVEVPPAFSRVMLVGHNPGLEGLLERLCGDVPVRADGKLLTTACVARVGFTGEWAELKPGRARLIDLVRPREMG